MQHLPFITIITVLAIGTLVVGFVPTVFITALWVAWAALNISHELYRAQREASE